MTHPSDKKSPNDPRREPAPGYAPDEPNPRTHEPKAPGEGRPDEPQNTPERAPDASK